MEPNTGIVIKDQFGRSVDTDQYTVADQFGMKINISNYTDVRK